jgi:hypothetical protein
MAALIYVLITSIFFCNLLLNLTTHICSDLADSLLNASIIAWNAKVLPLTDAWWNYPAFAPLSGVTAFTEHLLATYPIASPIVWLTGNPVLAYNVVFLLAFPLNGMAAYALGRELTGSSVAGFITGLAFAFAPYQSTHLSHLQMLIAFGMPVALLGLHRYVEQHRRSGLIYLAIGCVVTAFANAYMLLFFPILLVLWSVWFVRWREWRTLLAPAMTATAAAVVVAPLLWGYQNRQASYGFAREYYEISTFGADITALTQVSHRALAWWVPWTYFEGALFPGFAILALTVTSVVLLRSRRTTLDRWNPRLNKAIAVTMAVALARWWAGPWGWHFGPIPLPPFQPYQVFTVVVLLAAVRLVLTARFQYGWATRNRMMFYVTAAVIMWLLALGPEPLFAGVRAMSYGPYRLLLELPGAESIRVPARTWLLTALCLAVTAGFGTTIVLRRWPQRQRWSLTLLAVAIVAEGSFYETTKEVPRALQPGIIPPGALVLDLPSEGGWKETAAEYLAVLGGYRVLNGYSGYEPPHFYPFRRALADYNVDAIDAYRKLDDLYVIIRPGEDRFGGWIAGQHGAALLIFTRDLRIYRLPHTGSGPRAHIPLPLPQRGRPGWVVP